MPIEAPDTQALQQWARARERGRERVRVKNAPAYVLATTAWSETSLIAEMFTRQYGRVPVVVKGAKRSSSRFRGIVVPFAPIQVSFSGAADVKNLTDARWVGGLPMLTGQALLTGYYVNELLVRLTAREDPLPALFDAYTEVLAQIAHLRGKPLQVALRTFEVRLLTALGWGQQAKSDQLQRAPQGWMLRGSELMLGTPQSDFDMAISPEAARAIISGQITPESPLAELQRALRQIIGYYVGHKELNTRLTLAAWAALQ